MSSFSEGGGNASGSLSRKKEVASDFNIEAIRAATRKTAKKTEVVAERFTDIQENPFYQIVADQSLSAEQKRDAMAKALIVDPEMDKEENRKKLEAINVFKEFLQAQRTALHERNMMMSETGAFSDLQAVMKEMNGALLDFKEAMEPLTEMLDAVHKLQTEKKTLDVYREIRNDKLWREERNGEIIGFETDITKFEEQVRVRNQEIAELQDDRSLFGFGPIRPSSKAKIESLTTQNTQDGEQLSKLETKITDVRTQLDNGPGSDHPDLIKEKAVLEKILNITTDEHRELQEKLVGKGRAFVEFGRTRTQATLEKLIGKTSEIQRTEDVTVSTQQLHAIVDEATKAAEVENIKVLDKYSEPAGTDGSVVELARQAKLAMVNDFVTNLVDVSLNTTQAIGELEAEKVQVKAMKDANREAIRRGRELSSSGLARMAGQISTVMTAIGAAALTQSSEATRETMEGMDALTQDTLKKEVINNAYRRSDVNRDLIAALERIGDLRETQRASTEILEEAITGIRTHVKDLHDISKELNKDTEESQSVVGAVIKAEQEGKDREKSNDNKKGGGTPGAAPIDILNLKI